MRIEQMLVQGEGAFGVECAVVIELPSGVQGSPSPTYASLG